MDTTKHLKRLSGLVMACVALATAYFPTAAAPTTDSHALNSDNTNLRQVYKEFSPNDGIWYSVTLRPLLKWAKSDLLLVQPHNTAPAFDSDRTEQRKRRTYLKYKIWTPDMRPLDAEIVGTLPADTATGMPEFWIVRAVGLTKEEKEQGFKDLPIGFLSDAQHTWLLTPNYVKAQPDKKVQAFLKNAQTLFDAAPASWKNKSSYPYQAAQATQSHLYRSTLLYPNIHKELQGVSFPLRATTTDLPFLFHQCQAFLFAESVANLESLVHYVTDGEQRKTVLAVIQAEIKKLAKAHFMNYSLTDDRNQLANALILIEAGKEHHLNTFAFYKENRGIGKATYPFAALLLSDKSPFTSALRFNQRDTTLDEDPDPIAQFLSFYKGHQILPTPLCSPCDKNVLKSSFSITTSGKIPTPTTLAKLIKSQNKLLLENEKHTTALEKADAEQAAIDLAAKQKADQERAAREAARSNPPRRGTTPTNPTGGTLSDPPTRGNSNGNRSGNNTNPSGGGLFN